MRIKQKEQMINIAQSYRKLCNKLVLAMQKQDNVLVMNILQSAQESAIEWGETVERIEIDSVEFIHVLERMCELIYEIAQAVQSSESTQQWQALTNDTDQQLDKMLKELDETLQQISITYEFVFMPYKASMWDCMESVYIAATQDSNCNAVVVPIPYYNIEDNGKRKISCYEGNQMPDNIPVTYYEDYDISEHMPDAVFIHNPYDDMNLITSVYPEYYSKNLKKYTNNLIYIPYYVTGGVVPENHRLLSVHLNMDQIVLQSPKEEQYYEGEIFKGKFLSLGSPKFDKTISYEKNRPQCPEEWKNTLDGKKVFFYNTSISSLLNDTENALAKMEYVFSCFMSRKDVALIWRPHPLLEGTLRALRVHDYNRFQAIKQRFLESGAGIYDETADINKTIALSDAYIGEASSSVVHLFGVTGKPIFLLSNGLNKKPEEKELQDSGFTNIVECDGKLWTFLHRFNALCNIDMETGRLHIVTSIPCEPVTRGGLVSALYVHGNDIIMSPNNMDKIVIFHVHSKEFEYEQLKNAEHSNNMGWFVRWKDNYLIMPNRYRAIVEYDAQKEKFIYYTDIIEVIKNVGLQYKDRRGYIGGTTLLEDKGLLLISLARTNIIIIWNLEKRTYERVVFGDADKTYGHLFSYKDGVLVREFNGTTMYYWNMNKNSVTKWEPEMPRDFFANMTPFCEEFPLGGFFWAKNHYLIFPQMGNQILELDREQLELRTYPIDISKHIKEPQTGTFDNRWGNLRGEYVWDVEKGLKHEHTDFWIRFSADGTMMYVNLDTNETREIQPHLDLDEVAEHISVDKVFSRFSKDIPYAAPESGYVPLEKFIDAFVMGKLNNNCDEQIQAYREIAENMDGTCGQKIYEAIRNRVLNSNVK